jgi:hypothetical protein
MNKFLLNALLLNYKIKTDKYKSEVNPQNDGVLYLSMALQTFGPWPLYQFLNPIHSQ